MTDEDRRLLLSQAGRWLFLRKWGFIDYSAHWHFSTLLHIKLPGSQSRIPTVNREWDWSLYWDVHPTTLTFWVCSMLRMGKVMVGRLDCASIPAWKALPPCPSTLTSWSAAEHVSWSGPGFRFLLKDTWEGRADVYWYSKHVVLVLVLLPREEGGRASVPGVGLQPSHPWEMW